MTATAAPAPRLRSDRLSEARARELLGRVLDPEVPVLTILDLGIVRGVAVDEHGGVEVTITPTYSGCPAMDTIEREIRDALSAGGFAPVEVRTVLSPAWTTDWLSAAGRDKLRAYGIAPPAEASASKRTLLGEAPTVACPHCGSRDTEIVSQFGSTACKALYRCTACLEPFDYFKCL